jgi:hypothetical protein
MKKEKIVGFRMTEKEYKILCDSSYNQKISISEFLRNVFLTSPSRVNDNEQCRSATQNNSLASDSI